MKYTLKGFYIERRCEYPIVKNIESLELAEKLLIAAVHSGVWCDLKIVEET